MSANKEKLALFIDGANLYATAKSLGFDIDYTRLLREFQSRGDLLRAFFYTVGIRDHADAHPSDACGVLTTPTLWLGLSPASAGVADAAEQGFQGR
jgi:hypothetical protein